MMFRKWFIANVPLVAFMGTIGLKAAESPKHPKAGADQTTPAKSQYFSWINNTNEGPTEEQTLANGN